MGKKICGIYYRTQQSNMQHTVLMNEVFILEEFLVKYPYKVGDKVFYKYDNKTYFIRKMFWENGKVLYELSDEVYSDSLPDTLIFDVDVVKLQPFKEETMEETMEESANKDIF